MKKIKEIQERSSLNEGRNYGIGFAVLKPLDKKANSFETLNAFTACKDYLNDFSYVEFTKKEIGSIHGYNHKLLNCFNRKQTFYLGVNTLNFKSGNEWNLKPEALKLLIDNRLILEKILNKFEKKAGLTKFSKIQLDDDTLIIKAPLYWMKTTALISVYTLLIRCTFHIKEFNEDISDNDLIKLLTDTKCFINEDEYLKKNVITFYEKLDNHKFEKINYEKLGIKSKNASNVHNFGISGYLGKLK